MTFGQHQSSASDKPATAPAAETLGGGPPGGRLSRPSWGAAQVALGVLVLVGFIVLSIAVLAALLGERVDTPTGRLIAQAVLAGGLVLAALISVAGLDSRSLDPARTLRDLGLRRPEGPVVSSFLIAIGMYVAVTVLIASVMTPEQDDIPRALGLESTLALTVVVTLTIAFVGPIAEEVFFRGFVFGGLRRDLPFWAAAPIAGALFGLGHLVGSANLGVFLQLAFLGVILSWLYERTNSLVAPILFHCLNNALVVIFALSA